ncbi:azurin [Pedobacter flavus]|uniref:Azurin n=1 Tax=Pedobacter flavus TaxID=3113906 RepID=A0ABU7H3H5_9SPHI|nr:azurin [Pedobacter sp. VNH31]MEE1885768.1 azurin [Pedobacter sp. VNH31]
MKKSILLLAVTAMFLGACGNNSNKDTTSTNTKTVATGNEAVVTLSSGDDMKFDQSEIKVKAGQTVKLTLKHTGNMDATIMGHNFVLLASGVDFDGFVTAAMGAKATDYIPASMQSDVLAHTKVVGGGETVTIEFTAPAAGTYDFLCSFPGHSGLMKGKFIVE